MTGKNSVDVETGSASEVDFSNPKNRISDEETKMQAAALNDTQAIDTPDNLPVEIEQKAAADTQSPEPRSAEIQAAEKSLDRRRMDLDRQTQLLAARMQQVFEREQRLAGLDAEKRQLEEEKKELRNSRAELDNLKEIMDLEFTRDRKILVQERLQIARMREGLRLDRERFEAERGRQRKDKDQIENR
jgi:hypothetical protein